MSYLLQYAVKRYISGNQNKTTLDNDRKKLLELLTTTNSFPVKNKEFSLSFTGQRISSDWRMGALNKPDSQLGLVESIGSCIKDTRDQLYINREMQELIVQRVCQISAGQNAFTLAV